MAGRLDADPSELLAKALDLAVGGLALARYAATHTTDRRLRRTFQRVAASSGLQAQVLREQLAELAAAGSAGAAAAPTSRAPGGNARQFVAGAIVASVVIVGAGVAYRVLTAPPDDPLRRAMSRAVGAVGLVSGGGATGATP
jgi:hypothetical protein